MQWLIGNWKMAPDTVSQAHLLAKATAAIARRNKKKLTVIVCAPFVYFTPLHSAARTLPLGAQDVSASTKTASTGEISGAMLKSQKVGYCIVGHSERRAMGETDAHVKEKINRLLEKNIRPILCVGEKSRDSQGWYLSVIKDQIESAFSGVAKATIKRFIIAYEPVWAVGAAANRVASPSECREMVIFIRKLVADLYDEKTARAVPILYGGSINEENAASFLTSGEAQGLLVGRVSLVPKQLTLLAAHIANA
ncbi:MAG TPA: triose-phosphate isomerase [Candidatus Paceibacterota bacterium]|nr:triose-phosphate isomerase [Candidatus Paceibacterota bacterium]